MLGTLHSFCPPDGSAKYYFDSQVHVTKHQKKHVQKILFHKFLLAFHVKFSQELSASLGGNVKVNQSIQLNKELFILWDLTKKSLLE